MICKVCKNDVKYPIKHHIIRVKDRPDLKSEPLNKITICANCHAIIHRSPDSYLTSIFYDRILKIFKKSDIGLPTIEGFLFLLITKEVDSKFNAQHLENLIEIYNKTGNFLFKMIDFDLETISYHNQGLTIQQISNKMNIHPDLIGFIITNKQKFLDRFK